jgi:tRNA (guanine26-N2/guanine27-N2)-dimethyltransferase
VSTPEAHPSLILEGAASLEAGDGFFRPDSRPSRDLGVALLRQLASERPEGAPLAVLDGLAGCGIRSLRYGLEAGATSLLANDADPQRRQLLERNLAPLVARGVAVEVTTSTIQKLLARCLLEERRFDWVDLDAFGGSTALLPLAIEAVRFDGVLYLASTDGRSFTGHDRRAAMRRLGAAVRSQPCSWELALRLQLGAVARVAWSQGRGISPLFSLSDGRTFRTAVVIRRHPVAGEEHQLGLTGYCHGCGDHRGASLVQLHPGALGRCPCGGDPVLSGPLWRGPLQDPGRLREAGRQACPGTLAAGGRRRLEQLADDTGLPPEAWSQSDLARRLGLGPPPLSVLLERLRDAGWQAQASGVAAGQFRTDAPWSAVLAAGAPRCSR